MKELSVRVRVRVSVSVSVGVGQANQNFIREKVVFPFCLTKHYVREACELGTGDKQGENRGK